MRAENPAALRFILQDDIYLLKSEKLTAAQPLTPPVAETAPVPEPAATMPPPAVTETPVVTFEYMGGNKKQFLIITHYTAHPFIADAHLTALQNILKRKDHELDDVAILNIANAAQRDMDALITYFNPTKLLILGKQALPADIEALALNQPKKIKELVALYSFSFDEMMDSTDHKKAFWEQMKTL